MRESVSVSSMRCWPNVTLVRAYGVKEWGSRFRLQITLYRTVVTDSGLGWGRGTETDTLGEEAVSSSTVITKSSRTRSCEGMHSYLVLKWDVLFTQQVRLKEVANNPKATMGLRLLCSRLLVSNFNLRI
jgi:hypothetical protein